MRGWIVRTTSLITAALCATAMLLPVKVIAASNALPFYSLTAFLTVAPDLPARSQRTLTAEAERIWKREGVRLEWPGSRTSESSAPLRVLVIARRAALNGETERWPVGELVPQTGRRALAIASIPGAERVLVEAGRRRLLLDSPELADYRLGVVLGRAVAHEIGHYLLGTATHADHGLMRAAIDAGEFADPAARTFALDEAAGIWVRNRLLASRPVDSALPSAGFSYR
jgi:hypothetical protein